MGVPDRLSAILDTRRTSVMKLKPNECARLVLAIAERLKPNFGNLTRVHPLYEIMEAEIRGSSVNMEGDLAGLATSPIEKWERTTRCLPLVVVNRAEGSGAGIFQQLLLTYSGRILIWTCRYIVHSGGRTSSSQGGNTFTLGTVEALESVLTAERTNALLGSLSDKLSDSVRRAEQRFQSISEVSRYLNDINRRMEVMLRIT